MATKDGEELLLTLFADIHYYFSPPDQRPPHHRFDKGSYVYLYYNASQDRVKLEIANYAGTPHQDAVSGYLDISQIKVSGIHPTLLTVTLDAVSYEDTGHDPPPPPPQENRQQWQLPAADHRNEGRYMYKLHTLDMYFWTKKDASDFIGQARRYLSGCQIQYLDLKAPRSTSPPPSQIKLLDAQAPTSTSHNKPMSSVVQKLERMAVTGFEDRQQIQHSNVPAEDNHVNPSRHSGGGSLAGVEPSLAQAGQQPSNYVPIAYNPAAPAAPEPIKHREKTPPPVDAAEGTGLAYAATHDSGPPPMSFPPLQHQGSFPPPPPNPAQQQPSFPGPPQPHPSYVTAPPQSGSYQASQPSPAPSAGPHPTPQRASSFVYSPPPPAEHAALGRQQTQSSMVPTSDPNAQLYGHPSPSLQQQGSMQGAMQAGYHSPFIPQTPSQYHPPQHHPVPSPNPNHPPYQPPSVYMQPPPSTTPSGGHAGGYATAPPPPVGGYSNYQYGQPAPPTQYNDPSTLYGQAYRPTEGEAGAHMMKPATTPGSGGGGGGGGRFDSSATRLEKGVGRFLKRLEKRL
ncbi:MAG: hypothetical protein M1816_000559 [Peltula sp. TS41687]|nr:MAG: hypothetical protein M1816_000559 [Peltula sp. TS41687]